MNILFSDYDGTIRPYENTFIDTILFRKNIESINEFVKNNLFVITTARNISWIKDECVRNGIKYNYLIGFNGRVCYDNNMNLIYAITVDNFISYLSEILKGKCNLEISYSCDIYGRRGFENLVYIYISFDVISEYEKYLIKAAKEFGNIEIKKSYLFKRYEITSNFNKGLGAQKLIEYLNRDDLLVYSVGDGYNDLELLRDYNGYKMLLSCPSLYRNVCGTTTSCHSLIRKIEKKK